MWGKIILIIILIIVTVLLVTRVDKKEYVPTTKNIFNDVEIVDLDQVHIKQQKYHKEHFNIKNFSHYRSFNPTISFYKNKPIYIHRVSNYTNCTDIKHTGLNSLLNIYKQYDIRSFMITEIINNGNSYFTDLILPELVEEKCVRGFEDPRSLINDNEIYVISNHHTNTDCKTEMWLNIFNMVDLNFTMSNVQQISPNSSVKLTIDFDKLPNLTLKDDKYNHQKNWIPFLSNNELFLVYSVNPHTVLKCDVDTGECNVFSKTYNKNLPNNIRGGSQARLYNGAYYALTHKRKGDQYSTQIYRFNSKYPFNVTGITDDFTFNDVEYKDKLHIQFVSGFDIINEDNKDIAYITYGEQDCHSKLCKISMKNIIRKMQSF